MTKLDSQGFPRLKAMPRIPKMEQMEATEYKPVPPVDDDKEYFLEISDPLVEEILGRMGNKQGDALVAKRVATLLRKYPNGTIPELIAMDWLNYKGIENQYLAQIAGGRSRKGGAEVDLLFMYGGQGIAWMVNGDYWHTRSEVAESDVTDKLKFLGATYHGIRIDKVVVLWENKIYHARPQVFEWGLMGEEMGM